MTVSPHGYYVGAARHFFDEALADALAALLASPVLDAGCGNGSYVRHLRARGIEAHGVDGNPALRDPFCRQANLALPWAEVPAARWVLSLEVGEHIPAEFAETFMDNLSAAAAEGLVLSWAIPGQPGLAHVNCLPNETVIAAMRARGWRDIPAEAAALREAATLGWFKNTIMVFRR